MNHLLRELAPISDIGWEALDSEAKQRLVPALGARRLVDFSGPHGWRHSATNLGHIESLDAAPNAGVSAARRSVLPLVELRAEFELSLAELRSIDRGADDTDLTPLDDAAHKLAVAENVSMLEGWDGVVGGIAKVSPHKPIALKELPNGYAAAVAGALEQLQGSGVAGPFALALSPDHHRLVIESAKSGGYLLADHLREMLGGPLVSVPGISGAIVISQRGGDFIMDAGQDVAIGYDHHDGDAVGLYLVESFSFHVATPEAAVVLRK